MTYVPDGDSEHYISHKLGTGFEAADALLANASPWMFYKFTGCSPNTTIGYVRIFVTCSF